MLKSPGLLNGDDLNLEKACRSSTKGCIYRRKLHKDKAIFLKSLAFKSVEAEG
jgi:hypothetical protein